MWRDFTISIVSGLVASGFTGALLVFREQFRWRRTRNLFLGKISGEIHLAGYEIIRILDIDVTYEDAESPKPEEEIIGEIMRSDVSADQFGKLDHYFRLCMEKIERLRAQALAIPTFTSEDFHHVDADLQVLRSYTSAHYFFTPLDGVDEETPKLKKALQEKLVEIYRYRRTESSRVKLTWKQKRNRKRLRAEVKRRQFFSRNLP